MKIVSSATAFPRYYYPQEVLSEALKQYWGDRLRIPDWLTAFTGTSA